MKKGGVLFIAPLGIYLSTNAEAAEDFNQEDIVRPDYVQEALDLLKPLPVEAFEHAIDLSKQQSQKHIIDPMSEALERLRQKHQVGPDGQTIEPER